MLNVHYQLALTYEPVHLSLYVSEQGARFLRTQSQMIRQCLVSSQQLRSRTPASDSLLSAPPNVKRATRKWHVTLTVAYFLHTLPPRQSPSSFGFTAIVVSRYQGGLYKKLPTATMKHQVCVPTFTTRKRCCRRNTEIQLFLLEYVSLTELCKSTD